MRKRTLDHHMVYFQYLNTTIYGKKRTYCHLKRYRFRAPCLWLILLRVM